MPFIVRFPSTAIDDPSGGGTVVWSNTTFAKIPDETGSVASIANGLTTHRLSVGNFGFSIPSNTIIKGIVVLVSAKVTSTATISTQEFDVRLLKNSSPASANKSSFVYNSNPGIFSNYTHGNPKDLWGTTWTASDINDAGFGAYIQLRNSSGSPQTDTVEVDYIEIGIVYSTIYSEVASAGSIIGGSSLVAIVPSISGGAVAGGESLVLTNPTSARAVAGGAANCSMIYSARGADGIYLSPQSIANYAGWTGNIANIQEGVNSADGDSSYIRGVNSISDYLFVNLGTLAAFNGARIATLRISVSSEYSSGSLTIGFYIGSHNIGNTTVSPPVGSYATFSFNSYPILTNANYPITAYLYPNAGAPVRVTAMDMVVSSIVIGGTAINYQFIMTNGGLLASGTSTIYQVSLAQGGSLAGGSSTVSCIYNNLNILAGSISGGTSDVYNFIPCLGGANVGGTWIGYSGMLVSGGAVAGSTSNIAIAVNIPALGGVLVGANATLADLRVFETSASGGVFVSGEDDSYIKDRRYMPDGQVNLGGSATVKMVFYFDLTLNWNVRSAIIKDLDLSWNVGQLPLFWYRVIGRKHDGTQCNLIADPCCQQYIVNIHARTPAELCQKLSSLNLNMPIDSVHKFTRPAENAVIEADAAKGISYDCNQLVLVDVCQIPSCAELCVDYDLRVSFGFSLPVFQVNAFYVYSATGTSYVNGIADVVEFRNVPNFGHTSSGLVQISGSSDVLTNFVNVRGGCLVGGAVDIQCNRWTYTGGSWPYYKNAFAQQVISETSDDAPWINPELSLDYDHVDTFSDISYGKKSQYLILTGFDLGIASGDNVLEITVGITCRSTGSYVKETDIYLVSNNGFISDNLADSSLWSAAYSFRKKHLINDWNAILSPEIVNDPSFGVAIRVQNFDESSIALAKIDGVSIRVAYENPDGQKVHITGVASVLSTAMSYEGDGNLSLAGYSDYSIEKKFSEKAIGGALVGGAGLGQIATHNVISTGGMVINGISKITPFVETGSGGLVSGGAALVKPYFEFGNGGVVFGGSANNRVKIGYLAKGGAIISGVSPIVHYHYEATGSVYLSGECEIVASARKQIASGFVYVSGSSNVRGSYLGTFMETGGFESTVSDIVVVYANDQNVPQANVLSQSSAQCECLTIPLVVNFAQNLAVNNKLSQFLFRNNLTFPSIHKLKYNSTNNSWQTNLHYKGVSVDGSGTETWDMVFELQCTKLAGGIDIGDTIWKLSIDIIKKGTATYNTRLVVGVLPSTICGTLSHELIFNVLYNTQLDNAVVDPSSTIYQAILFDNIGLFKNKYWVDNPELVLKVSQSAIDTAQVRVDLTSQVLVN